jgi:diaminohydroxyphosphoribosylaminopyrimidine deaminase / 5-amino-6-(5-phosphoribosylamino)uracil reductase
MTTATIDTTLIERSMRRALDLAELGPPRGVNPQVGCVILAPDGSVLAEGWHRGAGTAHAEVDALGKLAPGAARGSTVVVTLEPCNHVGRTGPCTAALIEADVARVVYGTADPGRASSGGAARLRDAGIDVRGGVLENDVTTMLGDWLPAARLGRPFVTVKWASSLDGRAAAADGTSRWITGPDARRDVHLRRAAHDAIAVGTGTILADDPALTARADAGTLLPAQPVPVVFGRRAIPATARINDGVHSPVLLPGIDLRVDLEELHERGIRSLFVEGGPTLASAFIAAGLADELLVYLAPTLLGGPRLAIGDLGIDTIDRARPLAITDVQRLGDDLLVIARFRSVETDAPAPTEGD